MYLFEWVRYLYKIMNTHAKNIEKRRIHTTMLKTFHTKFMLLQIKLFVFVSGFEPRKRKVLAVCQKKKKRTCKIMKLRKIENRL